MIDGQSINLSEWTIPVPELALPLPPVHVISLANTATTQMHLLYFSRQTTSACFLLKGMGLNILPQSNALLLHVCDSGIGPLFSDP